MARMDREFPPKTPDPPRRERLNAQRPIVVQEFAARCVPAAAMRIAAHVGARLLLDRGHQ